MVLKFFPIFLILFLFCRSSEAACSKLRNGRTNVEITNVTEQVDFTLTDYTKLDDYEISTTYTWDVNVPIDNNLDGFIYCFHDNDEKSLADIEKRSIPFPFAITFPNDTGCEGENIWVHDMNGTYGNCNAPCNDELGLEHCFNSKLCSHLRPEDCKVLRKDARNITLPTKFGRKYTFEITPYSGLATDSQAGWESQKVLIYCGHHLVETLNVSRMVAYEFCTSNQNISELSTASGPAVNFTIYNITHNFDNTATVVLQWLPPHDVVLGRNITSYLLGLDQGNVDIINSQIPGRLDPEGVDPYYYATVERVAYNETVIIVLQPALNRPPNENCGLRCELLGDMAKVEFEIRDIDGCAITAKDASYCSVNATCVDANITHNAQVFCECAPGFVGNGVSPTWDGGQGCRNYNACESRDLSDIVCAVGAVCVDQSPPSVGVACHCHEGFFGDGYRNGTGCTDQQLIVGLAVGIPLTVACFLLGIFVVWKYRVIKNRALEIKHSKFVAGRTGSNYSSPPVLGNHGTVDLFGAKWEIPRSDIIQQDVIGRGNFGVVHKALIKEDGKEKVVAVKSLSGCYSTSHREDFLAELALLISLGHHGNVMGVLGVCTGCDPADPKSPLLVAEFMKYGDLLHFLWKARNPESHLEDPNYEFTELNLIDIGRQVTRGLDFLAKAKVIHGDVAARNILVGEDLQCKISDFGLANDVYRYGMIKGATERRVPFKWVSPERMTGGQCPITWRSDVWSFGILLYEMVTLGSAPYPSMSPDQIYSSLKEGYRIPRPYSCSEYLYNMMLTCWQWEAIKRPTFKQLEEKLSQAFNCDGTYVNISSTISVLEDFDSTQYELDIGRRDDSTAPPNGCVQTGLNDTEAPLSNGGCTVVANPQTLGFNPGDITVNIEGINGDVATGNGHVENRV